MKIVISTSSKKSLVSVWFVLVRVAQPIRLLLGQAPPQVLSARDIAWNFIKTIRLQDRQVIAPDVRGLIATGGGSSVTVRVQTIEVQQNVRFRGKWSGHVGICPTKEEIESFQIDDTKVINITLNSYRSHWNAIGTLFSLCPVCGKKLLGFVHYISARYIGIQTG